MGGTMKPKDTDPIKIDRGPGSRPFGLGFYEISPSAVERILEPRRPALGAVAALAAVVLSALGAVVLGAAFLGVAFLLH